MAVIGETQKQQRVSQRHKSECIYLKQKNQKREKGKREGMLGCL